MFLWITGGSSDRCPLNRVCSCQNLQGKLFADCSERHLTKASPFSEDVIGISFEKNNFTVIPKNLPEKLLYLDMSKNLLVSITQSSLRRYKLLQNFSVSYNQLTEVTRGTFQWNLQLRELDVSHNMGLTIEVIHNISFDLKSSNIQRLNFENLHCTYGLSQIFKKYHVSNLKHTQLQELNLASNRIHSLEFGGLSLFPKSLRVFNIANNVLSYGFYIMGFSS